jgi:ABC-type sugar transport system, periplasmic component
LKKAWIIALGLMLVVALAACGGGNGGNSDNGGNGGTGGTSASGGAGGGNGGGSNSGDGGSGEPIVLTFWTLGNNNYEELAEEWNKANPNIQVTIQNTGDQTEHHNRLLTALSANSGAPDLFHLEIAFVDRFLEHEDKFHNLLDLGAGDLKDMYLDWKWKQVSNADGTFLMGLPTDIGPTAVFYRPDLAEAAGLPSDPDAFSEAISTWDKFVQVARDYTAKTGKPFVDLTDLMYNALRDQSDGEIYFSRADGSLIIESNAQVKKAFDITVQGIQEGWISKSELWSAEWYNDMNTDGFVVSLSPAWMVGVFKGNAPDTAGKWRIAQMPEGAGNWGGAFVTLPKEGKHPKEAFQFASWLLNKEQQLKSFQVGGLFPSIPELYSHPDFTSYKDDYFGGQATGVAFGKAAERVKPMYYGPLHDTADGHVKKALRNVLELKADPETEWKNAVDEIKKLAAR